MDEVEAMDTAVNLEELEELVGEPRYVVVDEQRDDYWGTRTRQLAIASAPDDLDMGIQTVLGLLRDFVRKVKETENPDYFTRFIFTVHDDVDRLEGYQDVSTPFVRIRFLNILDLLFAFRRFLQYRADREMQLQDGISWAHVGVVNFIVKAPRRITLSGFYSSEEDALKNSKSIRQIRNGDNLCVLHAYASKEGYKRATERMSFIHSVLSKFSEDEAREIRLHGMTPDHMQKLANVEEMMIHEAQFIAPQKGENILCSDNVTQFTVSKTYKPPIITIGTKVLFLLRSGSHVHLISTHHVLLGGKNCAWFCRLCLKHVGTSRRRQRYDKEKDWYYHSPCVLTDMREQLKACEKCGRDHFLSYKCKKSPKELLMERNEILSKSENPVPFFIEPVKSKGDDFQKLRNIIFYDFETYPHPESHVHTVTHVAAVFYEFDMFDKEKPKVQKFFERYQDNFLEFPEEEIELVNACGRIEGKYFQMEGEDCLLKFGEFLSQLSNLCEQNFSLFAHNGSRFDNLILMKELRRYAKPSDIILNSTRVMRVKFKQMRLTLRDSYLLLPFPLSSFAKTFGLKKTKDYYPYNKHTPQNLWYSPEGIEHPSLNDFNYNTVKSKEKQVEMKEWYDKQRTDLPYHLNEICRQYCLRDVLVLTAGCHQFRQVSMEKEKVDPFTLLTIPALVKHLFLRDYLEEGVLEDSSKTPLFPKPYLTHECSHWLSTQKDLDPDTLKIVPELEIEICGQVFKFFPNAMDRKNIYIFVLEKDVGYNLFYCPDETFSESFSKKISNGAIKEVFKEKIEAVKRTYPNHSVRVQYEHAWKKEVKRRNDGKYKMSLSSTHLIPSLEIKQSYFGGRVEPWMYFARADHIIDGKICKIDVVSLYPSVMLHNKYPIGEGVRYSREKCENFPIEDVFGFIHCSVFVPPTELYPLLPHQHEGKLMFPTGFFTGVWTSVEVQEAVQKGNVKILKVHDILHYEKGRTDLFTNFIQSCIQGKMEASGLPPGKTMEEYVKEAKEKSGITINPENVKKNPIARLFCKLKVNSFYGKFAENAHAQGKVLFTHEDLWNELLEEYEELDIVDIGYHQKYCSFKPLDSTGFAPKTNVAIASFVTAYARLVLWNAVHKIDQLGHFPIYGDTDSITYLHSCDSMDDVIPTGAQVGEWEEEHRDDIDEVVVIAPKAYSCKKKDASTDTHFKGVTLHVSNQARLSHKEMKEMILGQVEMVTVEDFRLVVNHKDLRGPTFPHKYAQEKVVRVCDSKRKQVRLSEGYQEYQPNQEYERENMEPAIHSLPIFLLRDEFNRALTIDHPFIQPWRSGNGVEKSGKRKNVEDAEIMEIYDRMCEIQMATLRKKTDFKF